MDKVTTIGVDIAKRIFAVYWVDGQTGEIGEKTMTRAKFEELMRRREPSRVVVEAGGSAHYWGRWLARQGHEVRLIAAQHVRVFVRTNKTDGADARAVWEASRRPGMKWVAVKSEASQAVLSLHRMRTQVKDMRRMQSNQLKALLYEFGIVAATVTTAQLDAWVSAGRVPALLRMSLCEQIERIAELKRQERALTRRIEQHNVEDALASTLLEVPGIGTLTASALAAELGEGAAAGYTNGRQYAACKGITPRLSGTGGKVRVGAISKRGDPYVRTLLIHGARSVISHQCRAKSLSPWLQGLLERRPLNVAVVALANKMARTAWALAVHGRSYQAHYGAQAA